MGGAKTGRVGEVDEDVDLVERLVDLGERRGDTRFVRHVELEREGAPTRSLDTCRGGAQRLCVLFEQCDVCAMGGQAGTDRRAEASARSGDDSDLVGDVEERVGRWTSDS